MKVKERSQILPPASHQEVASISFLSYNFGYVINIFRTEFVMFKVTLSYKLDSYFDVILVDYE